MTSTYEIRFSDNVPMAVEVDEDGRVVAAAAVFEESLLSMGLDTVDQLDIEDYLEQDYDTAEQTAAWLFGHRVVQDAAGFAGYPRWTCQSCSQQVVRQPYMSDAQWEQEQWAFLQQHRGAK